MVKYISPIALVTLSILLFEHCTTVTLTRYTQQRTDAPRASPLVVVLLTEMTKLFMSVWLELTHTFGLGQSSTLERLQTSVVGGWRDTIRVSVPAFLYTVEELERSFPAVRHWPSPESHDSSRNRLKGDAVNLWWATVVKRHRKALGPRAA